MADEPAPLPLYEVPYTRLFPWLRLFRCAGAAADPKRLMLAALGVLIHWAGREGLSRAFHGTGGPPLGVLPRWEPLGAWDGPSALWQLAEPLRRIAGPFSVAFSMADARTFAVSALSGLWGVLVWGFVGGAIARVAVVGLARGERVGLGEALRFATRKAGPMVGTPLIPMLGVVILTALLAAFGLLYRVPGPSGSLAAGVLAFLPVLGGLVLAMIVVGLAAGWPLMPASVAAEAEDGFDAMSRAYAYVHQRPWNYAAYAALAAAVGAAGLIVVDVFARLVVHLAAWGLSFGGPSATVQALYGSGLAAGAPAATAAHRFWLGAVGLLVRGWVFSYFWTAAAAVYLLLRHDVDGTPFGTVAYQSPPSPLAESAEEAPSAVPAPHATGLRDPGEVSGV